VLKIYFGAFYGCSSCSSNMRIVCSLGSVMSACGGSEPCRGETELEDLRTFVDETNNWIDQTLATLGWTREHIVKVIIFFVVHSYSVIFNHCGSASIWAPALFLLLPWHTPVPGQSAILFDHRVGTFIGQRRSCMLSCCWEHPIHPQYFLLH